MNASQNIDPSKSKKVLTRRNDLNGWILMLPMVVILYLFIWRPTVMGTVWSFFNMKAYTVLDFCGFDNFRKVLTHTQFLPTLWRQEKLLPIFCAEK